MNCFYYESKFKIKKTLFFFFGGGGGRGGGCVRWGGWGGVVGEGWSK